MIVSANGNPEPPSEIQRRLAQIDPALHLRFIPGQDQWALAIRWNPDDKRRGMIREGAMSGGDDWDYLDMVPQGLTAEEAYHYVVRGLRRPSMHRKDEITKLLERVHIYNKIAESEAKKPVMEYAEELIEANASTLFKDMGKTTTKVRQAGFGEGPRNVKRRAKANGDS